MSTYSMCKKDAMLSNHKEGIVSILDSDSTAATSLRRTLSAADMSSKKWLSRNLLPSSPTMKKIASSEQLQHSKDTTNHHDSFSSSSSESEGDEDIEISKADKQSLKIDTWSSIFSNKAKEEETLNPFLTPYIHPLVKRSKSSLSKKSLEICTENLGSETGSDVVLFSSDSNSSQSETEEDREQQVIPVQMQEQYDDEEEVAKQNLHFSKKPLPPRCFPPPMPSLHNMRSHRDGGRLFLEAVQAKQNNNKLCAQRQDGRLVLTFADEEEEENEQVGELEEEFVEFEEEEEDEEYDEAEETEEDEVVENVIADQAPFLSSVTNAHRLASIMMNKPIRTQNWSEKFNKVVNFDEEDGDDDDDDDGVHVVQEHGHHHHSVAHSLPPRPPSATSFNAYESYWHTPKVATVPKPPLIGRRNLNVSSSGDVNWTSTTDGQQLVVMRGENGGYLVHSSKSCKDSRRSFLFWGLHCIAT